MHNSGVTYKRNKAHRKAHRNAIKYSTKVFGAYIERSTTRRQMRKMRKLIQLFNNKQNSNLCHSI